MSVLYCQSPALFWCALALIVCFFVRRGAHRVRAVLDLVLGLLCVVGGVALYYLGMYNDAFTIRDFWQIRTAGWIGLAAVVLVIFRAPKCSSANCITPSFLMLPSEEPSLPTL